MKWPIISLADATEIFISGGTPDTKNAEYWSGNIPWVTGADISDDGQVIIGRRYINVQGLKNSATNIVPKGSILLVTRTGVGKIAIAPVDIAISQDFTGIVLKKAFIPSFILLAIKSRMNKLIAVQRGATIKGVTREDVKGIPIPLVASSEQRRIAEILEQADALRKMRVDADAKAERILPALFYRMFGNPLSLMSSANSEPISNMNIDLQNGFACGDKDVQGGIPHLRMNNIDDAGVLNLELVRTVPLEFDIEKYRLRDGDILFMGTNSEDKIGKACVFYKPDKQSYLFSNHLIRLRINDKRLNSEYLATYLHILWKQKYYPSIAKRWVNQASVAQDSLTKMKIFIPVKEKQDSFSIAFRNFLTLKHHCSQSSARLNYLNKALLNRAFSGSLTAKWRRYHMKELLAEMEEQAKYIKQPKMENA